MFSFGRSEEGKTLPIFLQGLSQANRFLALCVNTFTGQNAADFSPRAFSGKSMFGIVPLKQDRTLPIFLQEHFEAQINA